MFCLEKKPRLMSETVANFPRELVPIKDIPNVGLRSHLQILTKNASLRTTFWLAKRHVAARAISGLAVFIAAALFRPTDFAAFGIFLAWLNISGLAAFLRYDALLISASGETEFQRAVRLNLGVLATTMTAITAMVLVLALFDQMSMEYAALFVSAFGLRAAVRLLGGIVTRFGSFDVIGRMTLIHALTMPLVVLAGYAAGFEGALTMIASDIVANILAAAYLYRHVGHAARCAFTAPREAGGVMGMAWDWIALPKENLPAALLAMGFAQMPLLAILAMTSADIGGHVALLFRIMDFPVQLITAAATPVLMNRLSQGSTRWNGMPLAFTLLAAVVFAVYGSIGLGSFIIAPWLDQTAWSGIAGTVLLVATFQGAIAFANPVIDACSLYRAQRRLMLIHGGTLALIILAFLLAPKWQVALVIAGAVALLRGTLIAGRLVALARQEPI